MTQRPVGTASLVEIVTAEHFAVGVFVEAVAESSFAAVAAVVVAVVAETVVVAAAVAVADVAGMSAGGVYSDCAELVIAHAEGEDLAVRVAVVVERMRCWAVVTVVTAAAVACSELYTEIG